jgi:hypothetical protein
MFEGLSHIENIQSLSWVYKVAQTSVNKLNLWICGSSTHDRNVAL